MPCATLHRRAVFWTQKASRKMRARAEPEEPIIFTLFDRIISVSTLLESRVESSREWSACKATLRRCRRIARNSIPNWHLALILIPFAPSMLGSHFAAKRARCLFCSHFLRALITASLVRQLGKDLNGQQQSNCSTFFCPICRPLATVQPQSEQCERRRARCACLLTRTRQLFARCEQMLSSARESRLFSSLRTHAHQARRQTQIC